MLDVNKARAKMEKEGLDAIIALTLGNVYYSTGYHSHFCFLVKEHIRPVVIPKAKDLEPFIICPDHEVEDFKTFSQIKNFVAFPTEVFMKFDPGPSDHATLALEAAKKIDMSPLNGLDLHTALVRRPLLFLAKELKDRGLACGTIGVDCISLVPAATWEEIKKALPYATIKDASGLFFDLRKIKSAKEIDYISEATKITEAAIENSVAMVKEGVKQSDVVANLKRGMTGAYSEPYELSIDVLGAPATAVVDEKLERGNILLIDVGAKYKNYCCDVSRNIAIGEPSPEVRKIYDAIRKAQETMISMLKPGAKFPEIYKTGMDIVRKADPTYRRGHLGHGIGIELHEKPYFAAGETDVLEPGMVFTIELPYYHWHHFGLNLEDTFIVTKDGYKQAGRPGGLSRDLIIKK
jgi:Xaa-Pro aminopeptidase